jgi:Putative heavy-metal-binding
VTWRHPPHGEPRPRRVLITTSFDLPGYDVVAVQGEVFGLTVRCRNIGNGYLARLRSIGRGEIPEVHQAARVLRPLDRQPARPRHATACGLQ